MKNYKGLIALVIILVIILGVYLYSQHNANIVSSPQQVSTTNQPSQETATSPGQVTLEQIAYINARLGFQINLPEGWATTTGQDSPHTIIITDPTLKYNSQLLITGVPVSDFGAGVNLTDITVQNNLVRSISNLFSSAGGFSNIETKRISSSTIEMTFDQTASGVTFSSVGYIYFTPQKLYEVIQKIANIDDTQYITQLFSASSNTFKMIAGQ